MIALGREPVVLPLTRTVPLDPEVADAGAADAVLATSAAAIRHAPAALLAAIRGLPLHAVGEKTAEIARGAGFDVVNAPFADADALVTGLPKRLPGGGSLLYLAGRLRTGAVQTRLEAAGFAVRLAEVYDTVADETAFADAGARIGTRPLDAALVHSAYGAAMLSRLNARPDLAPRFETMRCVCISARVAEALEQPLAARAVAAARPDEAAMFALLDTAG
ncbi:MAG: uroporphyrinogen-III synthase [Rhizobiaceae bacterium]|nr:uroporphyrinogen-III synthase [Rhizobiaceae bacterium]